MIRYIFNRVQDEVESIDSQIFQNNEAFFKNHRERRYLHYIECLSKEEGLNPPSDVSQRHSQCLKEAESLDIEAKRIISEINQKKTRLYDCLNQGYIKSEDDNMDSQENKEILRNVEICLSVFKNDVFKTFQNIKRN